MQLGWPLTAASAIGAAIVCPALALAALSRELLFGGLAPGRTSRAERVRFRLDQICPFTLDRRAFLGSLISVEVKPLGQKDAP